MKTIVSGAEMTITVNHYKALEGQKENIMANNLNNDENKATLGFEIVEEPIGKTDDRLEKQWDKAYIFKARIGNWVGSKRPITRVCLVAGFILTIAISCGIMACGCQAISGPPKTIDDLKGAWTGYDVNRKNELIYHQGTWLFDFSRFEEHGHGMLRWTNKDGVRRLHPDNTAVMAYITPIEAGSDYIVISTAPNPSGYPNVDVSAIRVTFVGDGEIIVTNNNGEGGNIGRASFPMYFESLL